MPVTRINYALAAALLANGASLSEAASKVGAKNANVLKVGLSRKNVTKRNIDRLPITLQHHGKLVDSVAAQAVAKASDDLRATFAGILGKHAGALDKVPVRSNLKHLKRVGEVIEPLARTAKIVHGWDSGDKTGLLLEMCDPGAVIEIEPAKADCGVQNAQNAQIADQNTPQDTQAIEPQGNGS